MKGLSKKKLAVGSVSILVLMILTVVFYSSQSTSKTVDAAVTNEIEIPVKDLTKPLGTSENPFVIVEVVPYSGFASIGYTIAGQEPINLEKLAWEPNYVYNGSSHNAASDLVLHPSIVALTPVHVETFFPDSYMKDAFDNGSTSVTTETKNQDGYYVKVEDGTGDYKISNVVYDVNGVMTDADFIADADGDYVWHGYEYGVLPSSDTERPAGTILKQKNATLYKGDKKGFENTNVFLKECLLITDPIEIQNYHIKVITVTAKELNVAATATYDPVKLIDSANLIFVTDKSPNPMFVNIFNAYWDSEKFPCFDSGEIISASDYNNVRFANTNRDITWKVIQEIFFKKANKGLPNGVMGCPVVYDTNPLTSGVSAFPSSNVQLKWKTKDDTPSRSIYTTNMQGYINNVYKLGVMLRDLPAADLYAKFFATGKITESTSLHNGVTTGVVNNFAPGTSSAATLYWGDKTFLPLNELNNNMYSTYTEYMSNQGYTESFSETRYAMDGMYIYNADNAMLTLFNTAVLTKVATTKEAFAFFENLPGYVITGATEHNPRLSSAEVIRYLLNVYHDGEGIDKVRILEVQPGEIYFVEQENSLYHTDGYWLSYIRGKITNFSGTVEVERMTTREFNCRIEDLNETYDFVYIGSTYPNLASGAKKYFKDGNRIKVYDNTKKMFNWTQNQNYSPAPVAKNYFYSYLSGNDISNAKRIALKSYSNAGYPIIFAEDLVNDDLSIKNVVGSDTKLKDLVEQIKGNDSTLRDNHFSGHTFAQMLQRNYCYLECTPPVLYQDPTKHTSATLGEIYINGDDPSKKEFSYKIKINQASSNDSRYKLIACIDSNADGTFDEESELINVSSIYNSDGYEVSVSSYLYAGIEYKITIDAKDYVGAVTWKLKVVRDDKNSSGNYVSTGICTSTSGISAVMSTTDSDGVSDKVPLKILQIISNPSGSNSSTVTCLLPTNEEIRNATRGMSESDKNDLSKIKNAFKNQVKIVKLDNSTYSVDTNVKYLAGMYYYYTKDLNNYELTFERLTVDDFATQVHRDSNYLTTQAYDMVIIGFADSCSDIRDANSRAAINTFISQGKAILFTHDTTIHWKGNNTTDTFREKLGMDRYGMMTNSATVPNRKDSFINTRTSDSGISSIVTNRYGFTDQLLERYRDNGDRMEKTTTDRVSQINSGQITKYPYEIDEIIPVGLTHAQYFQLDFNKGVKTEGDADNADIGDNIVVWYNLYDKVNSQAQDIDIYQLNDGQNGYYIYNIGNITYSGAGHNNSMAGSTDEVRLFVNTIIAAHRAQPTAAKLRVMNDDSSTDGSKYYVYSDYDINYCTKAIGREISTIESSSVATQYKRVYFKLTDTSPASSSHTRRVSYSKNNGGTIIPLSLSTKRVSDNLDVSSMSLSTGEEYYVDVPIDDLKDKEQIHFLFRTHVSYVDETGVTQNLERDNNVVVVRRGIFNMN